MSSFLSTIFRPLVIYAIFAFGLNFIWESLHAPHLYASHTFSMSFWPLMAYVSSVDTALLLLIFFGGALLWQDWRWYYGRDSAAQSLYIVMAGVIIALIIEIKAVYIFHQWTYSDLMPTIFGIGLSPLVQLAVTGLVALWVCRAIIPR
ncbi:MAG: hypothetical protein Q8Q23_06050 [bacterium]|nr:hypothetical protein [bacterium]